MAKDITPDVNRDALLEIYGICADKDPQKTLDEMGREGFAQEVVDAVQELSDDFESLLSEVQKIKDDAVYEDAYADDLDGSTDAKINGIYAMIGSLSDRVEALETKAEGLWASLGTSDRALTDAEDKIEVLLSRVERLEADKAKKKAKKPGKTLTLDDGRIIPCGHPGCHYSFCQIRATGIESD